MRLLIAAVGRLKDGPERQLYARYADRIAAQGKAVAISSLDLVEVPEGRASSASARRSDEAERLLAACGDADRMVLLDENGKDASSRDVATLVQSVRDEGMGRLCFLIGGADGHGDAARHAAHRRLSLGRITLPHGLARVVLAEQLYRAVTIIAGHPYHRD